MFPQQPQSPYQQPQQPQQPQQTNQNYAGSQQPAGNYERGNQYNDQLDSVSQRSYPFNNLMTVGLVHRVPGPGNTDDRKDRYMFFVTMVPGVNQQGGGRTYDFQNRVTQKFSTREIAALAFILKQCAIGNYSVLPYSKFSRSAGATKTLSVWTGEKQVTIQNQQHIQRQINITVSSNGNNTIQMDASQAFGMGAELDEMFKFALNLEMNESQTSPQFNSQNSFTPPPAPAQGSAPTAPPMGGQQVTTPSSNNAFNQQPQAGDFGQQQQQPQTGGFGQQQQPQAGGFGQQQQPQAGGFGQQPQNAQQNTTQIGGNAPMGPTQGNPFAQPQTGTPSAQEQTQNTANAFSTMMNQF